jgi:hypothetical protein
MQLPFSVDQFFSVFRQYNQAVWPAQFLLVLLAVAALVAIALRRTWSGMAVAWILALLWAWVGVAYHLAWFTSINPLAYAFGIMSIAGAAIFVWLGIVRRDLHFIVATDVRTVTGLVLVVYALVVYPAWSTLAGHGYPELPTFGLPCPTTIFTIGVLALATGNGARVALVAPILWSLIGGPAAFLLDVPPDAGLLASGLIGLALALRQPRTACTVGHEQPG